MFNFVTVRRLSELSGYSNDAIRCKIKRGDFIEGIHYRRAPDNRILMDLTEVEKWIKSEA